jgi:N-acetylglucosamine kinase-like BadF-type ATPase
VGAKFYVGVDGGGTKTECVVADDSGRLLGMSVSGPSGYHNIGVSVALSNLKAGVDAALAEARLKSTRVSTAFLGLSCIDSRRDAERLYGRVGWIARKVLLEDDSSAALAGAFSGGPGIVALSGTGSVVRGMSERGQKVRVGGWGYLIGDDGSAFDIGRQALARTAAATDAARKGKPLCRAVLKDFGVNEPDELIGAVNTQHDPVSRIASLATLVSRVASNGDPVSLEILEDAGTKLAHLVLIAAKRLDVLGKPCRVSRIGSVFESKFVSSSFERELRAKWSSLEITLPDLRPSVGAVLLAMQADALGTSPKLLAGLRRASEDVQQRRSISAV